MNVKPDFAPGPESLAALRQQTSDEISQTVVWDGREKHICGQRFAEARI